MLVDKGLILEGGGMRAAYTAGVLDCFLDEKIYFENIYGVSAGVCHASSYVSQQKKRAIHVITDFTDDKKYAGIKSLMTTGNFFGVKMIYDLIPNKLIPFDYHTFKKSPMNLYAVVTNCHTGQAEYPQVQDAKKDMIYIRASSSLPLLAKMVYIKRVPYLDGGISDSIPLAHSIAAGNEKNVVVLTRPCDYKKNKDRLLPALNIVYRNYPKLIEAIATRHLRYNDTLKFIKDEEKKGTAFVIQPAKPLEIGRIENNREKLWELYQLGYNDAQKKMPELKRFITKKQRFKLFNFLKNILNK